MRNKFLARLLTLVIFVNFSIPGQVFSAAVDGSKAFNRNAKTESAPAAVEQSTTPNRIPESFFKEAEKEAGGPGDGTAPGWQRLKKILPEYGYPVEYFGKSVSISGDTAIVGSPLTQATDNGSAYIFQLDADKVWKEIIELFPDVPAAGSLFGRSVAISKDTVIIGAPHDGEKGYRAGAAYIFKRNAQGVWERVKKIFATPASANARFGESVSIFRNTAIIGSPGYGHPNPPGAAYIFVKTDAEGWTQKSWLSPNGLDAYDAFGTSVAISENTAVVGAPQHDSNGVFDAGAVYFFKKGEYGWDEKPPVSSDDNTVAAYFGQSVSIDMSENEVLVGAPFDTEDGNTSGAAYFLIKDEDGNWYPNQKVVPEDASAVTQFGLSVSLSNKYALIGSPYFQEGNPHWIPGADTSGVYVFAKDLNEEWIENRILLSDAGPSDLDRFGFQVCISGNAVIVGSPYDDDNGQDSGSAYIFGDTSRIVVSGTILEYETENPIPTAKLTVVADGITEVYNVPGGEYLFTVRAGSNVSLTPSAEGYTFPDWAAQDNPSWLGSVTTNVTKHFRGVSDATTVTVSGTLRDHYTNALIQNSKLTKTINGNSEVLTLSNGTYSFNVHPGDQVSVTPTPANGYTYPAWAEESDNPSWSGTVFEDTVKNFRGVNISGTNLTVSGTVKHYETGQPIANAKISAYVNNQQSVVSVQSNGSYSFTVHPNDYVKITPYTPNSPHYTFPGWAGGANPNWEGYVQANTIKDFKGVPAVGNIIISGTVRDYYTNQPIPGAKLLRVINGNTQLIDVSNGTYTFNVFTGDSVALIPQNNMPNGYTYPAWAGADNPSWSGTVGVANIAKHFKGVNSNAYITVSGTIKNKNGGAIPTAILTAVVNGTTQVIPVPNINYSLNVPPGAQVKITPSAPGFAFPAWAGADNPDWQGQVTNSIVKHFVGGYTIIVKTDGTLGALVKKISNTPEEGTILAYLVAPGSSFNETFIPITPANYEFVQWEVEGKGAGKGAELTLNIPSVTNNRIATAHFVPKSPNTR